MNEQPSQPRVAVVISSTRPTRICADIAGWVADVLAEDGRLRCELVDLAEIGLPMLDEPLPAAGRIYEHEHSRAWSRIVLSFDGFMFVAPQYNWGYPAPLKNALDFLYAEWRGKPASFLSYGSHGGNRAAEQLGTVLQGLKMQILDHVEAVITDDDVDAAWQLLDVEATLHPTRGQLSTISDQLHSATMNARDTTVPDLIRSL